MDRTVNTDPNEQPKRPFKMPYRIIGIISVGIIVVSIVSVLAWPFLKYYFVTGPQAPLQNPQDLPKPIATQADQVNWHTINATWLTSSQAKSLRQQTNVVNFALLENGNAKYAADFSIPFSPKYAWKPALTTQTDITTVDLEGKTGVVFTTTYGKYHLNLLQPFAVVQSNTTSQIYMFVLTPEKEIRLYTTPWLSRVTISEVQQTLQMHLDKNPNLSFTY